jgi:hypothetical protein
MIPSEIGHVLFIDIVGYSKLLISEQSKLLQTLCALEISTALKSHPELPGGVGEKDENNS